MKPECLACKFFLPVETDNGDDVGQCRRYPPVRGSAGFPLTMARNWCGEFQHVTVKSADDASGVVKLGVAISQLPKQQQKGKR